MGTITCGFWRIRFWISPEEFETFMTHFEQQGFSFYDCTAKNNILTVAETVKEYRVLYKRVTDPVECLRYAKGEFVCCSPLSVGFHGGFHLNSDLYDHHRFGPVFLQLASPKGYSVDDEDGYFHFEDMLQKEPRAKEMFDIVTADLKKITRPLYRNGNPIYSIRISHQAWIDLQSSAVFREYGEGLSAKWSKADL